MNPALRKACSPCLASVALLAASVGLAQESDFTFPSENFFNSHWYLGVGMAQLDLQNDHPSIGNNYGTGLYILGGYQLLDYLSVELSSASIEIQVGPTCDLNVLQACQTLYYPADSAEYANLIIAIRLDISLENYPKLQPWISTGFAYQYYSWDNFWYFVDGSAPFIGAGLDINVYKRWDLRLEVNHTSYDSTDNYGHGYYRGSTRQFDAALVYNFR